MGLDNLYPSVTLIFQAVWFKYAVTSLVLLNLFITGFRGFPPFPCHRPISQPASYTSTPLHTLHQVIGLKAGLSGTGTQDENRLHKVVFKQAMVGCFRISNAFPSENEAG